MFDPARYRILLISIFFLMLVAAGHAQFVLRGKITDAVTHAPVPSANVFLSNTSVGTITDVNGEFRIRSFPAGRYELVVSSIGYEAVAKYVSSTALPGSLDLSLQPKINELKEVVVEPFDKDGWDKWGPLFMENFIGSSSFAKECELVNRDAVKFRYSSKKNVFRAWADEPLVIKNRALGYIIKYELARFEFDLTNQSFLYKGYAHYGNLPTKSQSVRNRWAGNREEAYRGSVMHFMRSLWNNRLAEEKFEVHKLLTVSQDEQDRIRKIYKDGLPQKIPRHLTLNDGKHVTSIALKSNEDSLDYYKQVKQAAVGESVVYSEILPADSISVRTDAQTAVIGSGYELMVIYLPKKDLPEFRKYLPTITANPLVSSKLSVTSGKLISVLSNGSYFEGTELDFTGFMAWWGKMCNKLPFDYAPSEKNKGR